MLGIVDSLTYSNDDWMTMQTAHMMASAMLQRDPTTHDNAGRLARAVMKLFDRGIRDPKLIAVAAADQETLVSAIGTERGSVAC
ncbi:histidine phosphatase family protein [Phyllobacterium endophyticum]|uniref:histidine phosphatase family protein n=1 Tax=Phyllobacterium endophyticum TaxID=1149773 RepID=UPI0011C866D2|nr:histidine phosphatase family protein [Phyllobacterium endophyticum]TXR46299.1 histidine phosphatase family protein [Phyllobacterium endophyticum]